MDNATMNYGQTEQLNVVISENNRKLVVLLMIFINY